MGLLDGILGNVLGAALGGGQQQGAGGGNAALINAVVGMLSNGSAQGGLGGLVGQLTQAGLGNAVQSWIGTGANQAVTGDQLHNALGADTIGALAQQLGMGHGEVAGGLAQILPEVINQLTPHGQVPQGGLGGMADILGMLTQGR